MQRQPTFSWTHSGLAIRSLKLACMLLHSMARREAKDAPAAPNTIISSVHTQYISGAIGLRLPAAISVAP